MVYVIIAGNYKLESQQKTIIREVLSSSQEKKIQNPTRKIIYTSFNTTPYKNMLSGILIVSFL